MNTDSSGITLDLPASVANGLELHLANLTDPDRVVRSLQRFVAAARDPQALAKVFNRDPEALPALLQLFAASSHLSELLIADPEGFERLRVTDGQPAFGPSLVDVACRSVAELSDDAAILTALRRFKRRETLRIAYGDILCHQSVEVVMRQNSLLADAICAAACQAAFRGLAAHRGTPRRPDGQPARFAAIALGTLGGAEMNYADEIELMFVSDGPGETDGRRALPNDEFFERLARQLLRLLQEPTELGIAYSVDSRMRPEGKQGPLVIGLEAARQYYDVLGRTWERQAFVKARVVAGDVDLGHQFVAQLQPWIYRRYLSAADIAGIKHLKRRIEHRASLEGDSPHDLWSGHGGIRDVQWVIQFLQLLNGGDLPAIRVSNTLEAIARLEQSGCLNWQERTALEENYSQLRRIEHRVQILFDPRTRALPDDEGSLRELALRCGHIDSPQRSAVQAFRQDHEHRSQLNHKILRHLLQDAFADDSPAAPEVELVLDPDPPAAMIEQTLARYGFERLDAAYRHLVELSTEPISFLSPRRCRHFLAAIAPRLLEVIAATPLPDNTIAELSRVSESLGGKGILWELFSQNAPSLRLYVRLCAASPYLSNILTGNPGMIDELMDSLVLDRLPTLADLDVQLTELARGAEDLDPILHSFKHAQHLRVGVRDILGKEDIRDTHRALSDIAESCLQLIARREYQRLLDKFGEPTYSDEGQEPTPCEYVLLALGKLGGREPNYHSDLDVVFLYEAEGTTRPLRRGQASTTNQHFFSQLAQRIIKAVTHSPLGRLYEFDSRLRPAGASGSLALSLAELRRCFHPDASSVWQRQALCKARAICGSGSARDAVIQSVRAAQFARPWDPALVGEIREQRKRLEATASPTNLKRGPGGTLDVEFAVQMLQLRFGQERLEVMQSGTLDAITALRQSGVLSASDADQLGRGYRFLRNVESRLRLLDTPARHDFPHDPTLLAQLAFLLQYPSADALAADCQSITLENRQTFEQLCDASQRG